MSFGRAPSAYPSVSKNLAEIQCLSKLFQVLANSLSETFPK